MPAPFVTPPSRTARPSIWNSSAMRLGRVSVVRIASEKASPRSLLSSISCTPASIFSIGNWRPIMPVEEQSTSSLAIWKRAATNSVIRFAFRNPCSPVAQLALPLLTMTACALPLCRCFWQTSTGAARVALVVKVPAAMQGTSDNKIARSLIEASDLMPQAVAPARKPWGAVTQLSTSRNSSDTKTPPPKSKKLQVTQAHPRRKALDLEDCEPGTFLRNLIVLCGHNSAQPLSRQDQFWVLASPLYGSWIGDGAE